MSYIPPHKRINALHPASAQRPSPSSPPSVPRRPYSSPLSPSPRRHPDYPSMKERITIRWAQGNIRRFLAMLDDEKSANAVLEFERFRGNTFVHLQDFPLYTLRVLTPPEGSKLSGNLEQQEVDDEADDRLILKLRLDDVQETKESPWLSIVRTVHADLFTALEQLRSSLKIDNPNELVVPKMVLRFGRFLFNSNTVGKTGRPGIECIETFSPRALEQACEGGSLFGKKIFKTFDNCLSLNFFSSLEELAHKDYVQSVRKKERYLIQVQDLQRPDMNLVCNCSVLNSSETESESKENSDRLPAQLVLNKVKLGIVRRMIVDIACVEKRQDMRLALYTQEHLLHFSEEEREAIEWIVSTARIDQNVKGGLYWPGGCLGPLSNRFKVAECSHQKRTALRGAKVKWNLQYVSRIEYKTSSGRTSYEVGVLPLIWSDYFKGKNQCNPEDIIQSVTDILEFVWTQCI